jgi:hypothetical protein
MSDCRICIETLENGFTVEVPDMAERAKRETAAKKSMGKNQMGKDSPMAMPYMGDATKEYAAKTTREVLAIVKTALEAMGPGVTVRAGVGSELGEFKVGR